MTLPGIIYGKLQTIPRLYALYLKSSDSINCLQHSFLLVSSVMG